MKIMGVRPTQLTESRKNRLAKLFRILTCQMCRSDTLVLTEDIKLLLGGVIVDNDLLAFEKLDVRVFPSGSKMKEIADYIKNNA